MKKYVTNYTYQYSPFVIKNLVTNKLNTRLIPTLSTINNILQSGHPARLSDYLFSIVGDLPRYDKFADNGSNVQLIKEEDIATIYFHTAIMRFQILLIELLTYNQLHLDEDWNFNLYVADLQEREIVENISYREEFYGSVQEVGINALKLAIDDILLMVKKSNPDYLRTLPAVNISMLPHKTEPVSSGIYIDFSFKKYTEEVSKYLMIRSSI